MTHSANPYDTSRTTVITATTGRDHGKSFRINEVPPVQSLGYVLRLLAALRLGQQDELLDLFRPAEPDGDRDAQLAVVMRVLTGCDPQAVTSLINDALRHVEVAADPQHPTAFRALIDNDIREMATLGDIVAAFVRVNLLGD